MLRSSAFCGLILGALVGCPETQVIGEGTVFDICGRPVQDAVVFLWMMSEEPPVMLDSMRTDAHGRFRFSAMLWVSRPQLRAELRLESGLLVPMTVLSDRSPTFRFAYRDLPADQPCDGP
jgi:hypothetical protein